jgi:integrase
MLPRFHLERKLAAEEPEQDRLRRIDGKCAEADTPCKGEGVPKVNFQVLRRTVATHVQGMGGAKDTQTMLRHTKPDTAQINYVQPIEDSVRAAVDKLASTLLG